jgi:tetratricopeptide (TPR) repeat protein
MRHAGLVLLGLSAMASVARAQRSASTGVPAELWSSAPADGDRDAAHWDAFGEALERAGRYKAAAAAYQRAIQLGVTRPDESSRKVARVFIRLGDEKQASRWMELALMPGARPVDSPVRCRTCGREGSARRAT